MFFINSRIKMNNNSYFKQLNTLRFFAITLVIIEHFAHGIGNFLNAGYYGVDLFFVISGFLITRSLINNKNESKQTLSHFFYNRALRIFPIYYATIIFLLLINNKDAWDNHLFLLTYSYNYAWDYLQLETTHISHFWSLCVEEQFYLIWPFFIVLLRKKQPLMQVFIILIIILSGAQFAFGIVEKMNLFNFHSLFPRSYSLTIGALAATYSKRIDLNHIILKNKYIEALLLILLFGLLCFERGHFMILLTPFISVILILKTLNGNFSINYINRTMNNSTLQHIGLVSYGIYIFHLPLCHYLDHFIFNPIWNTIIPWEHFGALSKIEFHPYIIRLPLYFFLSYKLASVSFKYIESKILQYKIK